MTLHELDTSSSQIFFYIHFHLRVHTKKLLLVELFSLFHFPFTTLMLSCGKHSKGCGLRSSALVSAEESHLVCSCVLPLPSGLLVGSKSCFPTQV